MVLGVEKQLIVKKKTRCGDCEGNRCLKGTLPKRCWTCYGRGVEVVKTGPYLQENPCKNCQGSGLAILHKCQNCHGHGLVLSNYLDTVRIHQFVEDGELLRFEHHGHFAASSYPGDLYLTVFLEPHPFFSRTGLDLIINIPVSYSKSVLGGKVKVPQFNGEFREIEFERVLHQGKVTFENQGLFNRTSGKRGSQVIVFSVNQKEEITNEEKSLFKKLGEMGL